MGRPRKDQSETAPEKDVVSKDPLIKTVSEVEAMTFEEKAAFRKAGGTTISNPQ